MTTTPNTNLPFIQSVYLDRRVWLDELVSLTQDELNLLATEVDGIQAEASASINRAIAEGRDYGIPEKLLRVANRFNHAISREESERSRKQSFLELFDQLKAVTAERDTLRYQLDRLLAEQ